MGLKIIVLKNTSIDISQNFKETTDFFAKHNIKLEFTFKNVDIPISIKPYKEVQGFNPVNGKPSLIKYYGVANTIPLNQNYDCNIFIWDIDTVPTPKDGAITSFSSNYIQLAINKYLKDQGKVTNRITHEIMHFLCRTYGATDEMDMTTTGIAFAENDNPESLTGNYARTFRNLAPYIDALPKVTITRKSDDGVQTLGKLTYGDFWCDTLERPYKDNKPNISCIPKGIYKCVWSFSPKFLKYTYEVQAVPKRSGIRIHSGNYFFDIEGCVLLGMTYKDINSDGKLDILNSRITTKQFEERLKKQPFLLTIL